MERHIAVDLDADGNVLSAVVEERRELEGHRELEERRELDVGELFNENGELRLWQDRAGWNGYVREGTDDEGRFYEVTARFDDDSRIEIGRSWTLPVFF